MVSGRTLCLVTMLAIGCFVPLVAAAELPPLSGKATADFAALKQLSETHVPFGVERGTDAYWDYVLYRARALRDRGLEFIAAYPDDPLRWDALVLLQYSGHLEIMTRADGSRFAGQPPLAAALWRHEYLGRLEDLLESSDARREARLEALTQLIDYYCSEIRANRIDNPRGGLVPALLEWLDEIRSIDSRSGRLGLLYIRVARMLNVLDTDRCLAFLEEKHALHQGSHYEDVGIRRYIENFRRLVRNQQQPAVEFWEHLRRIEPSLDPAQFRSRVVLVAWLAVDWTSNTYQLEELHRKYHGVGLDILHIAYENRGQTVVMDGTRRTLRPAPLVQRDKATMERYVAEKKWPWPVFWESVFPDQDLSRAWAQHSVPCFFILRRDGRLAREIPGELSLDVRIARELAQPE